MMEFFSLFYDNCFSKSNIGVILFVHSSVHLHTWMAIFMGKVTVFSGVLLDT